MAAQEVATTASVADKKQQPKKKIFGTQKQADLVIYRLVFTNDVKMREDTPLYPPYIRFPNYDIIKWDDGTRAIRWLPGETSIFVDEQEKNGRKVPDNIIHNPNNRFEIINGDIRVRPHEKTKIQFLDFCNRNANSEYRTGVTIPTRELFSKVSEEQKIKDVATKQQRQKEAIDKAFSADEAQIAFHAKYLGIRMIDETNATRSFDAVQTDYRQRALDDTENFLNTFDSEDLKLKYKIETAIENKYISIDMIPGKAVFSSTHEEICELPATVEISIVVNTLWMFSQTKNGEGFLKKILAYEV